MTTTNIILWLGPLRSNDRNIQSGKVVRALNCAISGNEPSSVMLYKRTTKSRQGNKAV